MCICAIWEPGPVGGPCAKSPTARSAGGPGGHVDSGIPDLPAPMQKPTEDSHIHHVCLHPGRRVLGFVDSGRGQASRVRGIFFSENVGKTEGIRIASSDFSLQHGGQCGKREPMEPRKFADGKVLQIGYPNHASAARPAGRDGGDAGLSGDVHTPSDPLNLQAVQSLQCEAMQKLNSSHEVCPNWY